MQCHIFLAGAGIVMKKGVMKNAKNVFFVTLIFVLVLPVLSIALGTIIITPQNTLAARNSTNISVPVNLENEEDVASFELQLNYSDFLIFKGVNTTARMINATVEVNEIAPGSMIIGAIIPDNIISGNGTIFNAIFDVDENAVPGNYTVSIINVTISNIDMETLPFTAPEAVFTIVE
jgi:hypothetical protein